MEPLSALSLATSVVQFVDFSSKFICGSMEIYNSKGGQTDKLNDLEEVTKSLAEIASELEESDSSDLSSSSKNANEIVKIATECRGAATQLCNVLSKLKLQKVTKRESILVTLKSLWGREKVEDLRNRLDGYRQQLIILLLVAMREDLQDKLRPKSEDSTQVKQENKKEDRFIGKAFLDKFEGAGRDKWRADLLDAIRYSHECGTSVETISESAKEGFLKAFHSSTVTDPWFVKQVLQKLRFREMPDRQERIVTRHPETYEWIFHENSENTPWDSFIDWLKGPSSTYWLSGKPGSGKSTLMKFILKDSRTQEMLKSDDVSPSYKLVMTGFFFWNSGAPMQMSQEGLIRTLLHDCLHERHDLIPYVFPVLEEEYELFGTLILGSWKWLDVIRAFRKLLEAPSTRFCFFIDGLDEYSGNPADLIDLLNSVSNTPNTKWCISSRPWPIFEDAFSYHTPCLRLQDLTYPDMLKYTSDRLNWNPGFRDFTQLEPEYTSRLVDNIANKSSGVFLWVTVVVASLLHGLTNGDRMGDLQARLDALPPDLEALFFRILDSIEPSHKSQACKLFQVVYTAKTRLTLLQISYVDRYDCEQVISSPFGPVEILQEDAELKWMKRRLGAISKGLLEIANRRNKADSTVEYLHRTVKDFIEKPDVQIRIAANITIPFDAHLSLAATSLLELKRFRGQLDESDLRLISFRCMDYADLVAHTPTPDISLLVRLIDELHSTATIHIENEGGLIRTFPDSMAKTWDNAPNSRPALLNLSKDLSSSCQVEAEVGMWKLILWPHRPLHLAISFNLIWYARMTLKDRKLPESNSRLLCAALRTNTREAFNGFRATGKFSEDRVWDLSKPGIMPDPAMVGVLLEAGLNPNFRHGGLIGHGWNKSAWEVLLENPKFERVKTADDKLMELAAVFIRYGAKSKASKKRDLDRQINNELERRGWKLNSRKTPNEHVSRFGNVFRRNRTKGASNPPSQSLPA